MKSNGTSHPQFTTSDHTGILISIASDVGELKAEQRHHHQRLRSIESKVDKHIARTSRRSMHRGDWLQIAIGGCGLLLAARGQIPWDQAIKILHSG